MEGTQFVDTEAGDVKTLAISDEDNLAGGTWEMFDQRHVSGGKTLP